MKRMCARTVAHPLFIFMKRMCARTVAHPFLKFICITSIIRKISIYWNQNVKIVKNCNNLSCAIETPAPVEFCFLYDGTSPQDKFFKIGNSNLDLILKVNKTGYVEY